MLARKGIALVYPWFVDETREVFYSSKPSTTIRKWTMRILECQTDRINFYLGSNFSFNGTVRLKIHEFIEKSLISVISWFLVAPFSTCFSFVNFCQFQSKGGKRNFYNWSSSVKLDSSTTHACTVVDKRNGEQELNGNAYLSWIRTYIRIAFERTWHRSHDDRHLKGAILRND